MINSKYSYDQCFRTPMVCENFMIHQLGEISGNDKTYIKKHVQFCDELTFVVGGKGKIIENGIPYDVKKNSCIVSYTGEEHTIESNSVNPLHFCFIGFVPLTKFAKNLIAELKEKKITFLELPVGYDIFNSIITENYETLPLCSEMIGAYLTQLLLNVLRYSTHAEVAAEREDISLVYKLKAYMTTHLYEADAVAKIDREFNFSRRYLDNTFKASTGETLSKSFLRMRMERSRELLQKGLSVTETAELMGYSTIHPFSRAYKNYWKE